MNLGNIEAQKKNYQAAIDCYEQCIQLSPHRDPKSFSEENQVVFSGHLNSFEAYADAHANLAVMYVQLGQPEKAF